MSNTPTWSRPHGRRASSTKLLGLLLVPGFALGLALAGGTAAHAEPPIGSYKVVDACGPDYAGDTVKVTGDFVTGYSQPRGEPLSWMVAAPVDRAYPEGEMFEVAHGVFTVKPCPIPTITGTAKVGSTLTANAGGTWSSGAVTMKYQWFRTAPLGYLVQVTELTGNQYTLTAADVGRPITVRATAGFGYPYLFSTSLATAAIAKGTLVPGTPTITGTKRVGYTLTANPGSWGPGAVALTYRWSRSGVPISGAFAKTYKLVAADRYDTITVRVTGVKTGYIGVGKYAAPTVRIA